MLICDKKTRNNTLKNYSERNNSTVNNTASVGEAAHFEAILISKYVIRHIVTI